MLKNLIVSACKDVDGLKFIQRHTYVVYDIIEI